jgi:hypothetical protein
LREPTETEVEEIIFGLKNSDALGIDGIILSFLRHCLTDVVPSIVRVVNKFFETSVVPLGMKKSKVVPIYKQLDSNNYRPISVIPVIMKIMEKVEFNWF